MHPNSQRYGITAAGTWNVDYTKVISQFPQEGSCTSILSETINNGGAPYNLLVNLSRLGADFPLRAVGCIGKDLDGKSIFKDCRAHGFETARLRISPEIATGFSDVMTVHGTGVRTSFNQAGANALLSPGDFDLEEDASRLLYLGTLFFMPGLDKTDPKRETCVASVLHAAQRQGIQTCVDIERVNFSEALFHRGCRAAIRFTDLIILNVEVAEILTGIRIRQSAGVDLSLAEEAARRIREMGNPKWVVIRFPAGALALGSQDHLVMEGSVKLPAQRVVSASGAGHAFAAGFLFGYHEGWKMQKTVQTAHATAAACLTHKTASSGIKSLAACTRLLHHYGQRNLNPMQELTAA